MVKARHKARFSPLVFPKKIEQHHAQCRQKPRLREKAFRPVRMALPDSEVAPFRGFCVCLLAMRTSSLRALVSPG
jgi:hypothetical protein